MTQDLQSGGTLISSSCDNVAAIVSVYPEAGYRASFKGILLGGGPIAPDKLAQCEEKDPVIQSYGMTKRVQVVALKFEDATLKISSTGQPLKDMQIKIVDELGRSSQKSKSGNFT